MSDKLINSALTSEYIHRQRLTGYFLTGAITGLASSRISQPYHAVCKV